MPNRIIRESICRSDSIDSLSWFEEVLFYRLIVNADDYGRFDGRESIINSYCFPLKDLRNKQISDALNRLASVGMVYTYEVKAKPFLQIANWEQYQQIRAKRSKYPEPENVTCDHLISNDIKCYRNPIQSNPNPNPNPSIYCAVAQEETENLDLTEEWFNSFWELYPKKSDKKKAKVRFIKICKNEEDYQKIIEGLKKTVVPKAEAEGTQYIPLATTWLNGERWNDEPYKSPKQKLGSRSSIPDYMQRQKEGEIHDKPATKEQMERAIALQKAVCCVPLPDYMQRQKEGKLRADPVTEESLLKLEALERKLKQKQVQGEKCEEN